jgi:hypothetical protein
VSIVHLTDTSFDTTHAPTIFQLTFGALYFQAESLGDFAALAVHRLRFWSASRSGADDCISGAADDLLALYLTDISVCDTRLRDASGNANDAALVKTSYTAVKVDSAYYGCDAPGRRQRNVWSFEATPLTGARGK